QHSFQNSTTWFRMDAKRRQSRLNALRGVNKPFPTFSRLRSESDPTAYRGLIRETLDSRYFAHRLFHPPFPANALQLKAFPVVQQIPLENELRWASEYLRHFSEALNTFVRLRGQYHRSMIDGNFAAAEIALAEVENTSGLSLWLIKARL